MIANRARRVAALAAVLVISLCAGGSPAGAAGNNGAARIVATGAAHRPLRSGGSATPFNLKLGANPTCPGDSAGGNYRIQSFMVPSSADLNGMTFGASGPVAVEGQFRQPLFGTDSSPYVDKLTDLAVPPAATGGISGLPSFDFSVFGPGDVPSGDFAIGIACTLGPAGPTQLKTYWSVTVTLAPSAGDAPAGFTWSTPGPPATNRGGPATPEANPGGPATPTTTAATGGAAAPTTTSETGGATTTTAASADLAFAGAEPSDPSVSSTLGQLRLTGSSPWHFVIWGLCLLVLGRMAILLARRPKVPPPPGD